MWKLHGQRGVPPTATPSAIQVRLLANLVDAVDDLRQAADRRVGSVRTAFLADEVHRARERCLRARWAGSMLDALVIDVMSADLPDDVRVPFDCRAAAEALRQEETSQITREDQ